MVMNHILIFHKDHEARLYILTYIKEFGVLFHCPEEVVEAESLTQENISEIVKELISVKI